MDVDHEEATSGETDYRGNYKAAVDEALKGGVGVYADFDSKRQMECFRVLSSDRDRLLKFAGAGRVAFLVDRGNLGRQTLREFQTFVTPDTGRKFTELYNVQLLTSNKIDPAAHVVITTIQRLYSILRGEPDLDPELDETSIEDLAPADLPTVDYNAALPVEAF